MCSWTGISRLALRVHIATRASLSPDRLNSSADTLTPQGARLLAITSQRCAALIILLPGCIKAVMPGAGQSPGPLLIPGPPAECRATYVVAVQSDTPAHKIDSAAPLVNGIVDPEPAAAGCSKSADESGGDIWIYFVVSAEAAHARCILADGQSHEVHFVDASSRVPPGVFGEWKAETSHQVPIEPAIVEADGTALIARVIDHDCDGGQWAGPPVPWK